jgi:hypothetical protein
LTALNLRACHWSKSALLLSLIGLYGVMSFVVTRRTREIGIRLALGATGASAIRLVLRDAVAMIAAGIAICAPLRRRTRHAGSIPVVWRHCHRPRPPSPPPYWSSPPGALVAAFSPAWRAANVSPPRMPSGSIDGYGVRVQPRASYAKFAGRSLVNRWWHEIDPS